MIRLAVDADGIIYRYALRHQHASEWDAETWTYRGDLAPAQQDILDWLKWLKRQLGASKADLFLSDATRNWRHDLYPNYKGQRAAWQAERASAAAGGFPAKPGPQRPLLFKPLRAWMIEELGARWADSLEADDLVGIEGSTPDGDDVIIVSTDKDLLTVPGRLFNPDKAESGVATSTADDACLFHLRQVLEGDKVDNYPGCPGLGPVTAAKLLAKDPSWGAIVAAYEKRGLAEEDALVQARIAHVCQHGDYDEAAQEIRLWTPEDICL